MRYVEPTEQLVVEILARDVICSMAFIGNWGLRCSLIEGASSSSPGGTSPVPGRAPRRTCRCRATAGQYTNYGSGRGCLLEAGAGDGCNGTLRAGGSRL